MIALVGLAVVAVAFVANTAAGFLLSGGTDTDVVDAEETLAWSWGLNTLGFSILKVAVAVILIGIVYRLWMRVDSVKHALARLRPAAEPVVETGDVTTPGAGLPRAPLCRGRCRSTGWRSACGRRCW